MVSLDHFFRSFFERKAWADGPFSTEPPALSKIMPGFFWNHADQIFSTSGERTCNFDVLGGPDHERAVFLRAAYPLAFKALINQSITYDLISDQKNRDHWSISLLHRIKHLRV